jgi:protein ImuA
MTDSAIPLARLRRDIERLAVPLTAAAPGLFTLGEPGADARLGGGLALSGMHEATHESEGDFPSACAFGLMLALRAAGEGRILIVSTDRRDRQEGRLYGPGLVELGLDPDRLVSVHAPDELAALRAAADIVSVFGVGAVLIDAGDAKKLDLTASRRLLLAAERSGVTAIVLRSGQTRFASAASTRWSVAAAPSAPLEANAPGQTALRLALLRHRGGVAPFETLLEWNRDRQSFSPPLLRDFPANAERGQMAA